MKKQKKIGIVTLSEWLPNYGSRLQYYAVQSIFLEKGWRAEMIQDARWWKNPIKVTSYWKDILHIIFRWYRYVPESHAFRVQILFFIKKFLHISPVVIEKDSDMEKLDASYDMFCAGSDQVWNPYFNTRGLNTFTTLQFTTPEKRTSFAASLGTDTMLPERSKEFAQSISNFRSISVREETGAKIVKELTGRDSTVLIDPTLMITGEDWRVKLNIKKRQKRRENYIFVFSYGQVEDDVRRYAETKSKEFGLKTQIVYFNELKRFSDWSVQSWLDYIGESKHVITNSFHCAVFATLFHVPFTAIHKPEDVQVFGSRIKNLMQICGMKFINKEIYYDEVITPNWNEVDKRLDEKRLKAWDYLEKTFA